MAKQSTTKDKDKKQIIPHQNIRSVRIVIMRITVVIFGPGLVPVKCCSPHRRPCDMAWS